MSSMNEKDSRIDISCDDKLLDPEMIETEKVVATERCVLVNTLATITCTNTFQDAFDADDFQKFKKHLKSTYYPGSQQSLLSRYMKSPSNIFDKKSDLNSSVFDDILTSSDAKAAKYISAIMKHFSLYKDENFLRSLKVTPRKTINLLSFLQYDWNNPKLHKNETYCLVIKSKQMSSQTGKTLLQNLFAIIDDENEKLFHDVCLRIIYQYLYEYDSNEESDMELFENISEFGCIDDVFQMNNQEYREKILQILVVFWKKTYNNINEFEMYEAKVLETTKASDGLLVEFFKLAFLLKNNKSVRFIKEFELYIEKSKNKFGDYFKTGLRHEVRLLFKITEREGMHKTSEFIFEKCPNIEVNSTIMENFNDEQEFKVFNIFPFEEPKLNKLASELQTCSPSKNFKVEELKRIETFLKTKYSDKMEEELKLFVFGRCIGGESVKMLSILERVLASPGASGLINLIWDKFKLDSREEILNIRNPYGDLLLDFVADSNDDLSLLSYLETTFLDAAEFTRNQSFVKLQNDQFKRKTGKTLFEKYIVICVTDISRDEDNQLGTKFFRIIFALLEELKEIEDLNEVPIDKLLDWAENDEFYNETLEMIQIEYHPTLEDLKSKMYYVDDLLGHILAYWSKPNDENFATHKLRLRNLSAFYGMLFEVIEHDEDQNEGDFIKNFLNDLEKLEESYKQRYAATSSAELYTTSFLFILMIGAINKHRLKIIDRILNYETFVIVNLSFPSNMRSNKTTEHVASKMLEQGNKIGQIPANWISPKSFNEFLDSRIKYSGDDLVELDCNFLLHPHTRKYKVKSKDDVDNKLIFWEDCESLEYIMDNESLKRCITHPVVSTYINLKTIRQKSVFIWNLGLFIGLFILPLIALIVLHYLGSDHQVMYLIAKWLFAVSILFLVIRETIQWSLIDGSLKEYFKKPSNWLEILLILISIATLLTLCYESDKELISFLASLTILLTTADLLSMLPVSSIRLHLMMLKKVGLTFLKFFSTFLLILVAFTISFYIILGINLSIKKDDSITNSTKDDSEDVSKNFFHFPSAFIKVVLMLSGEYGLEPSHLADAYQMTIFLVFILTTFILFNLILGLMVDDVQKLRAEARYLTLKLKANRFIEMSKKCYDVYEKYRLDKKRARDLAFLPSIFVRILKYLMSKHPYLHKIDKFYVNIKTKDFAVKFNRSLEVAAEEEMDDEAFTKIMNIINGNN